MQLHELTPTQLEMHQARKARLARMSPQAFNAALAAVDVKMAKPEPVSNVVQLRPEISDDERKKAWVKRQLEMRCWFMAASLYGERAVLDPDGDDSDIQPKISVKSIQKLVAKHFGIRVSDIMARRRTYDVVRPRQLAMYLSKTLTGRSLPEIGRDFGGWDHTTVLHAVRNVAARCERDPTFGVEVMSLRDALEAEASA